MQQLVNIMWTEIDVEKQHVNLACYHSVICWNLHFSTLVTPKSQQAPGLATAQSAEYVKYAKIFGDYFWLIFIPTEDLGDHFFLILHLLKILATHSS